MEVSHKFRVKKISLPLFALICTMFIIWAWEGTPLLTTFTPPLEQYDVQLGMLSPVTLVENPLDALSVYKQQQTATEENLPDGGMVADQATQKAKQGQSSSPTGLSQLTSETMTDDKDMETVSSEKKGSSPAGLSQITPEKMTDDKDLKTVSLEKKECNYAKGKWVADSRRPLYSGFNCKQWLSPMWACRLTRRPDFSFEHYRWQAESCEIPEFEGSKFLRRMQHKTIAFVGDSLGRQQFQSLMCMVTGGKESTEVKDVGSEYDLVKKPGALRPDGWVYRFPITNTTILYYWSASLCELEPLNRSDPATNYAMHLDRPATFLNQYLHRFDVLVLNTGHHWNRGKFNQNRWQMYVNGMPNTNRKLAEIGNAKNLTIYSVIKWVDSQLQKYPRLKVFFRSMSPRHFVNGDWNTGGSCDSANPLAGGSEVTEDTSADPVVESAVKGTRVKFLDITALSKLRDEGHISRYTSRSTQAAYDCLHWCLPGIPDTWNEILAAQV